MKVNIKKTKYIIFHNRSKKLDIGNLEFIYNDNEPGDNFPNLKFPIERIHSNHANTELRYYRTLGILIDDQLTLNTHFAYLQKKLSRSIYILSKAKHFLPLRILKTLYFSTFHCYLTYCPTILSCSSNKNINRITKLQKKAIRIIKIGRAHV